MLCLTLPALLQAPAALGQRYSIPEPAYPEKWNEIETYIRNNWMNYVESSSSLPKPYSYALNPGTLYYYDLYFINDAMLRQGFHEQVRNNLDCFIHEIDSIGLVANAWGWGNNRSQTPFFSMSVRDYYDRSPERDTAWLHRAYNAVLKEYEFWTNTNGNTIEDHSTPVKGLQRYSHHADTAELIEFYDRVLFYRFHIPREVSVEEKLFVAGHRLAECESMDFTPRYGGRCMDFIPVDLNANLYQYERNFAHFERVLGISDGRRWEKRADRRAKLIDRYLWNEARGLYLDYDFVNRRSCPIACIMAFTPLCWGIPSSERAARLKENLFTALEVQSGLTVCEASDEDRPYQFGRNGIWGSMQFLAMTGLRNAGFDTDARRIAMKYLNMVTKNYVDPYPVEYIPHKQRDMVKRPYGLLWEKFTHNGDINDNEYYCCPILGFTAAPYILALEIVRQNGTGVR